MLTPGMLLPTDASGTGEAVSREAADGTFRRANEGSMENPASAVAGIGGRFPDVER